jgi:hypothetical protein
MKPAQLVRFKTAALTLMLPGLAGLVIAAMISGHYLDTMPKWPSPPQQRTVPRNIHGIVVYQTAAEDRRLDIIEYSSVGVFLVGLTLGLVYLERWGARQASVAEEDEKLTEN